MKLFKYNKISEYWKSKTILGYLRKFEPDIPNGFGEILF